MRKAEPKWSEFRIWQSRADWARVAALGPRILRREISRRLSLFDPPERFAMDDPVDVPGERALARLAMPSYFLDRALLERHDTLANWSGVRSLLGRFAGEFIAEMGRYQVPMFAHGAFRTRSAQEAAFAAGHSRARWPRCPHCVGAAVDIVHGRYGWNLTRQEWSHIGHIGKLVFSRLVDEAGNLPDVSVIWGGDFKSLYDPAHWELSRWREGHLAPSALEEVEALPPLRLTRYQLGRVGFSNAWLRAG